MQNQHLINLLTLIHSELNLNTDPESRIHIQIHLNHIENLINSLTLNENHTFLSLWESYQPFSDIILDTLNGPEFISLTNTLK